VPPAELPIASLGAPELAAAVQHRLADIPAPPDVAAAEALALATHGARAAWLAVALSQELRGLSRLIAGAAQAGARTALAAGRATGGAVGVQDGGVALALAAGRTPVEWQRASWPIARLSAWIEQLRGSLDQVCALLFVPCSLCPAHPSAPDLQAESPVDARPLPIPGGRASAAAAVCTQGGLTNMLPSSRRVDSHRFFPRAPQALGLAARPAPTEFWLGGFLRPKVDNTLIENAFIQHRTLFHSN